MTNKEMDAQFEALGNKIHELFAKTDTSSSTPPLQKPTSVTPSPIQEQENNEYTKEQEQILKEERRMFFYYPKYLHPESVALIAQHLLDEWEDKAKQYDKLQKELNKK